LQLGAPAGANPATVIGILAGLLSPEAITNAAILVKAGKAVFRSTRSAGKGIVGLACTRRHVIAVISYLGTAIFARYCHENNVGKISKNDLHLDPDGLRFE
jgi:hypothetical protein